MVFGGTTHISTRYGAEAEPLTITVLNGELAGFSQLLVHFAIPPARAWDNAHQAAPASLNPIQCWRGRNRMDDPGPNDVRV